MVYRRKQERFAHCRMVKSLILVETQLYTNWNKLRKGGKGLLIIVHESLWTNMSDITLQNHFIAYKGFIGFERIFLMYVIVSIQTFIFERCSMISAIILYIKPSKWLKFFIGDKNEFWKDCKINCYDYNGSIMVKVKSLKQATMNNSPI